VASGDSLKYSEFWDEFYDNLRSVAPWEELPKNEMALALLRWGINKQARILVVGCGRAGKTVEAAKNGYSSLMGIDISRLAITAAIETANRERLNIQFLVEDFLSPSRDLQGRKFDVVVDWLCFHNMPASLHPQYIRTLECIAPSSYLLRCFSKRDTEADRLNGSTYKGISKYFYSSEEIETIFGRLFQIIGTYSEKEDTNQPALDGKIAAKDEYFMQLKV